MVGKGRDRPCRIHGQTPEGGVVLPTDGYKYILLYLLRLFKLNAIGGSQRANANCKSHGGVPPWITSIVLSRSVRLPKMV